MIQMILKVIKKWFNEDFFRFEIVTVIMEILWKMEIMLTAM